MFINEKNSSVEVDTDEFFMGEIIWKSLFDIECAHSRIASGRTKLFLDSEKLIVLSNSL